MSGPRQWLPWLAVAVLVAVAVGTAGWGNETSVRRHRPSSVPSSATVSSVRPVALVARADLVPGDFSPAYREVLARAGNDLDPGDRLHLCGAAAPPAAGRIAGHRRAFLGPDGERVRTEVAVYSDGGADHAVDALRDQAAACSEAVPPRRVEVPSVLALHVRLDRTAAQPGLRELLVLSSGDAVAVLESDGLPPARTIDIARLVAARLG